MADKNRKGRQGRGEVMRRSGGSNGRSKLTEQDVADIRANYALCCVTQRELAKRFGVSETTVSYVVNGKAWAHVCRQVSE